MISTNVIRKLLIMFLLWVGIIDISNAKHLKTDIWKIAACSISSNKSEILVYVRRWKKKLAAAFYSLNFSIKLDYCEAG